jgi:hypothetical protein
MIYKILKQAIFNQEGSMEKRFDSDKHEFYD